MHKIGVFIGNIDEQYQKTVWKGIVDEANERNINIICFPGLRVAYKENFEYQANIVYSFANKKNVDGLIILSNTIFYNLKRSEVVNFFNNYKSIPVINFGYTIPGFASIKVDSNYGIKELVNHIVKVHKYKRIAFIKGPKFHQEAENRFRVFCNELNNYNIKINDSLIIYGDFLKESGYLAAKKLIESGKDFDVIISANDSMAIGAIDYLQSINIMVPEDIAVVGYDDIEECKSCTPRLTTVHQPIYEKGREAVRILLEIIKEGNVEKNKTIPSSLIIRQSCGCFTNLDDININIAIKNDSFYNSFRKSRELIMLECKVPVGLTKNNLKRQKEEDWIAKLIDIYYHSIVKSDTNSFIVTLSDILKRLLPAGIDVYFWHNLISTLRRHTLKYLLEKEDLLRAECIWEQARIVIDESYYRSENIKKLNRDKLLENMWAISSFMSSAFDKKKLIDDMFEYLKKVEVSQCFLSLYENNDDASFEWSRMLLVIKNGQKVNIDEKGLRFKTNQLIPKKYFPTKKHSPLIIKPLYFYKEQLGFIVFEMNNLDPLIYDILRQQLSIALKGSNLMEEVKQHARILENEVARRTEDLTKTNKQLRDEIKKKKSIETALIESEKNLKSITEATPVSLLIISLNNGQILYSNEVFNKTFGFESERIMKIKIFDLFIDKNHIEHIVEHLKNNENITNVEIAVRHSDNSVFWVLASFQAMVFQGRKSFIAGFYDITKRKQLEKEILEISDREQSRIGQDLHDDLCQRLAGIAAMITALENNLKMDKYDDSKKAEQISLFLNEAIVQTKKLARGFYPVTLENHGLIYSIEELANNINMQHDISCKFYYNKDIKIKDKSVALHLYRITQEAVYNAVKHSEAAHIFIKLINDENLLSLIIEDDGKGFNCNSENLSGMGLKIMNYRSNMIGGKITVKSSDHGTSITCMIKV